MSEKRKEKKEGETTVIRFSQKGKNIWSIVNENVRVGSDTRTFRVQLKKFPLEKTTSTDIKPVGTLYKNERTHGTNSARSFLNRNFW